MTYFSSLVGEGAFIPDHLEGVCFLHLVFLCILVLFFNALAQAPELVCVRDGPRVFVSWMAPQLSEFKGLSGFFIRDKHGCEPWRGWCVRQIMQRAWVLVLQDVHASDVDVQVSGS